MNWCTTAAAILLLAGDFALANEQIRRVQEELRKRNLYFGEVDGLRTAEIQRAISRYQQRQGFPVTGQPDEGTLRSLSIPLGPVKPEEEWPEGSVVMKGDSARELSEEAKRVLEQSNTDRPTVAAATTPAPVAAPSPTAEPALPSPALDPNNPALDHSKLTPRKPAQVPRVAARPTPPQTRRTDVAARATPTRPERTVAHEASPPPIAERDRTPPGPESKNFGPTADPESFVRRYLSACEGNQLGAELSFYAPRMSYFDHGTVDRNFVAKDVQRFYNRWPQRHYELLSCEKTPLSDGEQEVAFKIAFHYENPDKNQKVSGRSLNIFRIREFETGPRFTSLKEQRLRN